MPECRRELHSGILGSHLEPSQFFPFENLISRLFGPADTANEHRYGVSENCACCPPSRPGAVRMLTSDRHHCNRNILPLMAKISMDEHDRALILSENIQV